VVTGTIIAVIGISLMRVGINWIFGNPFGPTAPKMVNPEHAKWLADVASMATRLSVQPATPWAVVPAVPKGLSLVGTVAQPQVRHLAHIGIAGAGAGVHPC
jgi:xanthine/uracil permease